LCICVIWVHLCIIVLIKLYIIFIQHHTVSFVNICIDHAPYILFNSDCRLYTIEVNYYIHVNRLREKQLLKQDGFIYMCVQFSTSGALFYKKVKVKQFHNTYGGAGGEDV
jgi:hypothetical protein